MTPASGRHRLPGLHPAMRRVVNWLHAGLPADGPWADLFYPTMVHGATKVRAFPRVFTAGELAQMSAPTLLLIGDHERVYQPQAARRAALRLLPLVQVEIIPGAHHAAAIAQPDAVNTSLLRFLGLPGGRSDDGRAEACPSMRCGGLTLAPAWCRA